MLRAYINFPNGRACIHMDSSCAAIQQQKKKSQRVLQLNIESLSQELRRFKDKEYRFSATKETNDMWIEIDMGDQEFERAVVKYMITLLAQHYLPFENVSIKEHC